MQSILFWNAVALETHRRDFASGKPTVGGPTRVSRALAIVHAAIYNAQEATAPRTPGGPQYWRPPLVTPPSTPMGQANAAGAVAGAAVAALKRLWPGQASFLDQKMQEFCNSNINGPTSGAAFMAGADYGEVLALAIYNHRLTDGHDRPDENVFVSQPGHHQADPVQTSQPRLSTHWGLLQPFLIPVSATGYVDHKTYVGAPPTLGSARYLAAVADVQLLGKASPAGTAGDRTPEQTTVGIFWGYDGPPQLGVPPRLYNQLVRAFVEQQASNGTTLTDAQAAHLFALVNFAMADSAIVAWGAKYYHDLWRPVIGIRHGAPGIGPNSGTYQSPMPATADPGWLPLGIPRTDLPGQFYFTPDFPAYPSGHATFGAAACRTVAHFYAGLPGSGADVAEILRKRPFTFISDEFDGQHRDAAGVLRPPIKKELTLAQAIIDNAVSRVYLGVHWRYDGLGVVAPEGLEGEALPNDPASAVKLDDAQEKKLGGVPAGLLIADQVHSALP